MAGINPTITIEMSPEVRDTYRVLSATRLQVCQSVECKHNSVHDVTAHEATCMLKAIFMGEKGVCGRYEVQDAKD